MGSARRAVYVTHMVVVMAATAVVAAAAVRGGGRSRELGALAVGTSEVAAGEEEEEAPRHCKSTALCRPLCLDTAWRVRVRPASRAACTDWEGCGLLSSDFQSTTLLSSIAEYVRAMVCVAINCCSPWEQPWYDAVDRRALQPDPYPAVPLRPRSCAMRTNATSAVARCAACRAVMRHAVTLDTDPNRCLLSVDPERVNPQWPRGHSTNCLHVLKVLDTVAGNVTARAPSNLCAMMQCCTAAQLRAAAATDAEVQDVVSPTHPISGGWADNGMWLPAPDMVLDGDVMAHDGGDDDDDVQLR